MVSQFSRNNEKLQAFLLEEEQASRLSCGSLNRCWGIAHLLYSLRKQVQNSDNKDSRKFGEQVLCTFFEALAIFDPFE